MSWSEKPSKDEMARWFAEVKLHDGMDHAKYIGGIVAIENRQTKSWNPYPMAGTRIAYLWDFVESKGYTCSIDPSQPILMELPFKQGPEPIVATAYYIEAQISFHDADGTCVRTARARKLVDPGKKVGSYGQPKVRVPDFDSLMKAETGAVARAAAMLGMLSLPGTGVASAEDIMDYLSTEGDHDGEATVEQKGRRAASPKAGA